MTFCVNVLTPSRLMMMSAPRIAKCLIGKISMKVDTNGFRGNLLVRSLGKYKLHSSRWSTSIGHDVHPLKPLVLLEPVPPQLTHASSNRKSQSSLHKGCEERKHRIDLPIVRPNISILLVVVRQ